MDENSASDSRVSQRIQEKYRGVDIETLPEYYREDAPYEKAISNVVENFIRNTLGTKYDDRNFFVNPRNECGIQVF
jgi:hypothetical protein